MPSRPPPPQQQALPLDTPPQPAPGELQAEKLRLFKGRPYWRHRYQTPAQAFADPMTEHVLAVCAAAALRSAIETTLAAREAGALQQAEAALDTLFDTPVPWA